MAIAQKLEYLNGTKQAIKTAIQNRGVAVSDTDTFRDYSTKIGDIGETVEKTKFGITIDSFLGNVDENGVYNRPNTSRPIFDLSGIKKVGAYGFYNVFFTVWPGAVSGVIANDISSVDEHGFSHSFTNCPLTVFEFNGLESIENGREQFAYVNSNNAVTSNLIPHFNKLKKVVAINAFANAFMGIKINPDETFPVLEEIGGTSAFATFRNFSEGDEISFGAIKKITGGTATYTTTFGALYVAGTVWKFPSATEFTGSIWNISSSYPGEIHFAAANQAAIEACDGYANKWGFAGATIYFDL